MFRSLLLLVCAFAALAQTQLSTVSGVVLNSVTRLPMEGVHVSMQPGSASTDSQGRFRISDVEAGRQWVSLFDQRSAGSGGLFVLVKAGEDLTGVEILLKPGGAISGKVEDEHGKPLAGVSVLLLEQWFDGGRLVHSPRLTVVTDKDGRYRLEPVPSEEGFLILARQRLAALLATGEIAADPGKRLRIPVATYYPNVRYGQEAQTIRLAPGDVRQEIDIRIAAAFPYCLEGRMEAPSGRELPPIDISEVIALSNGIKFTPATAKPGADGHFRACGFPPGDYRLFAVTQTPRSFALAQVSIVGQDVGDIALLLRTPSAVSADVAWDPPPPNGADRARIMISWLQRIVEGDADDAKAPDALRVSGATSTGERVYVPSTFQLSGPSGPDRRLDIRPLPPGCYVKQATLGTADIRHGAIDLINAAGRLHIVLACDGAAVTARVTDHDGNPVSEAHLYLMPATAESDAAMRVGIQEAEVEKGWGALKGPIPPGKYLAIACSLKTDGTAEPLIRLWRARSSAKEVEIGANGAVQVNLELMEVN